MNYLLNYEKDLLKIQSVLDGMCLSEKIIDRDQADGLPPAPGFQTFGNALPYPNVNQPEAAFCAVPRTMIYMGEVKDFHLNV